MYWYGLADTLFLPFSHQREVPLQTHAIYLCGLRYCASGILDAVQQIMGPGVCCLYLRVVSNQVEAQRQTRKLARLLKDQRPGQASCHTCPGKHDCTKLETESDGWVCDVCNDGVQ